MHHLICMLLRYFEVARLLKDLYKHYRHALCWSIHFLDLQASCIIAPVPQGGMHALSKWNHQMPLDGLSRSDLVAWSIVHPKRENILLCPLWSHPVGSIWHDPFSLKTLVALNIQLALRCFSSWGQVVCGGSQTRRPEPGPICWKGSPAATPDLLFQLFERFFRARHALQWNVVSPPKANRTDAEPRPWIFLPRVLQNVARLHAYQCPTMCFLRRERDKKLREQERRQRLELGRFRRECGGLQICSWANSQSQHDMACEFRWTVFKHASSPSQFIAWNYGSNAGSPNLDKKSNGEILQVHSRSLLIFRIWVSDSWSPCSSC